MWLFRQLPFRWSPLLYLKNGFGAQNSFCSFAISLPSSRVWPVLSSYLCSATVCCLWSVLFGSFGFCVLSLLFLLFKYAAVFSMTTNLTEGSETHFLLLDFSRILARLSRPLCLPIFCFAASLSWATLSAFSHYRNACYLLLALFFPNPPQNVCLLPCFLRLLLAFMKLIKTSLCSFGKNPKIKIKKESQRQCFMWFLVLKLGSNNGEQLSSPISEE